MFGSIDNLLRGRYTDPDRLQGGRVELPIAALTCTCLLLGGLYGASMGLFSALARPGTDGLIQVIASVIKVPLLFLATLVVTFPSLYVVSALARSRLQGPEILRLLLAAIAVNLALLASLAPVAAFFTLSTESYPFIRLLHILFFMASGVVGLNFLRRTLPGILGTGVSGPEVLGPRIPGTEWKAESQVDRSDAVFRVWIVIYGVVGAQMGWIMRPFIGDPNQSFSWFRPRDSNFAAAFFEALTGTFGG